MSLDQDQKAPFLELIEEGKTDAEIRESMGITQAKINEEKRFLRAVGLLEPKQRGKPKRELPYELRVKIIDYNSFGKTNEEMARLLSMSVGTLLKYKKMIRDSGLILKQNHSKGRPKAEIKTCPTCGQRVKE